MASDKVITKKLAQTLKDKGSDYRPRTRHLDKGGRPHYTNRLILEYSPYLLQHAHNPVDWYAWGEEAFTTAKTQDKPIFLSIGYSSCHWCHVMEQESFEDLDIATLLNKHYITIKLDREQHPGIDDIYMTAVVILNQNGGWPMSVFLTPEGKPFYGSTYFPKTHFQQLLGQIYSLWEQSRSDLYEQAERISRAIVDIKARPDRSIKINKDIIAQTVQSMLAIHDDIFGGFSGAPKFPNEPLLLFLLDHIERTADMSALKAVKTTLDAMAKGGIFDQIGGGFHRYSTDAKWLVPHFEKMLYNQAYLARIYLQAWQLTTNEEYRIVAEKTFDHVLRDMQSEQGAFYSAMDADSEGGEGAFFVWAPEQIDAIFGEESDWIKRYFGISNIGNFEHGKTVLHTNISAAEFAHQQGISLAEFHKRRDWVCQRLWQSRTQRSHPLRDEKVITAWNGMMIGSLALAAMALQRPDYLQAATNAADFIYKKSRAANKQLQRIFIDGTASIAATQEDYAFLAEGLLYLYDASQRSYWLRAAIELTDIMIEKFYDSRNGDFYMMQLSEQLTTVDRIKEAGQDNATPSGSSIALNILQMLDKRTGDGRYTQLATRLLDRFSASINEHPLQHSYLLMATNGLWDSSVCTYGYAARGRLFISSLFIPTTNKLQIDMQLADGWHINATQADNKDYIPTTLTIDKKDGNKKITNIDWPKPYTIKLGFSEQPLALYHGHINIKVQLADRVDNMPCCILPICLRFQVCNEKECLPPEVLTIRVRLGKP